jgi:tetratricopeptide (TPR) repeat protein
MLSAAIVITGALPVLADSVHDCQKSKDVEQRIAACTQVIQAGAPTEALVKTHLARASAYSQKDEPDKAHLDYLEAIKLNSRNFNIYYQRAFLFRAKRQFERAAEDWERAIDLAQAELATRPTDDARWILRSSRQLSENARRRELMEKHWIEYLKDIQSEKAHDNWSEPPFDLYMRNTRRR